VSTEAGYLRDLAYLLREAAFQAKGTATARPADDFQGGRAFAYYEVLSLMQQQAEVFDLPLAKLALEGFDADRDLLFANPS
jgi:hypothetical protein